VLWVGIACLAPLLYGSPIEIQFRTGGFMSPVTRAQRLYLGAVAGLALWVGIWCYFIPDLSDSAIPWRLPPLCASFLGAMYLSGAVFTAACMGARRWTDIRVVMPMIAIWTGGLTIISAFYLEAFNFARTQVVIWFGAYIVYPLIALGLMWMYRRQNSMHPLDEPALPTWVRRYLLTQGSVMVVLALGLLIVPRTMQMLWPWRTAVLMLQLYAAPLLSYGVGSFILMRQQTWSDIRVALIAMSIFTGAELGASLRYLSLLNGPTLSIGFWLAWLAVTTGMLLALSFVALKAQTAAGSERQLTRLPWESRLE
jgi:fluoride ion exporter CrcB/FEX